VEAEFQRKTRREYLVGHDVNDTVNDLTGITPSFHLQSSSEKFALARETTSEPSTYNAAERGGEEVGCQ